MLDTDELFQEFMNGCLKALGGCLTFWALNYVVKSNLMGSLYWGICHGGYWRETPDKVQEKLLKDISWMNKLFLPSDVRDKINNYKREYDNLQEKLSIDWSLRKS